MSDNLPAIIGSILPAELGESFSSFKGSKRAKFDVHGAYVLDIDISSSVIAIVPGNANEVCFEIDATPEQLKGFKIAQQGNRIIVHEAQNARASGSINIVNVSGRGSSIFMSNISGGSVNIVSDGVRITVGGGSDNGPRILVRAPNLGGSLEGKARNSSILLSTVAMGDAYVQTANQATIGVVATKLDLTSGGQSKIKAVSLGGDLSAQSSGQSNINVRGNVPSVKSISAGQSHIVTVGEVAGDYAAIASGQSSITHAGNIRGRVRESRSGQSSINLG